MKTLIAIITVLTISSVTLPLAWEATRKPVGKVACHCEKTSKTAAIAATL